MNDELKVYSGVLGPVASIAVLKRNNEPRKNIDGISQEMFNQKEKTPTVKKTSKTDITFKHDNFKRRIDRKP